ncbi:hypothetical protein LTR74_012967 [Friedmanniomyces endolithicus]|nr:hypothetical protein LTR74_012967 [Friedmanniomyces endolithicus]
MANHTSTASEPNENAPGNAAALANARSAYRYVSADPPSASDVPGLVSSASSASSETSGSISFTSDRDLDYSAFERMPFPPTSPPPPFNGSTTHHGPRRATASRRGAPSTLGSGGSVYAHTGGLYSSPPDATDYAYGDDLLADQVGLSAPVPLVSPATLYPDAVPQATGVRNSRHRQPMKPAMARWLDDDADLLQYRLSYGGYR